MIVDHLTPPLSRAEGYGELREARAAARRVPPRGRAGPAAGGAPGAGDPGDGRAARADRDLGLGRLPSTDSLRRLDGHLCELKELQIRDGLHVFGRSPEGELLDRPDAGAGPLPPRARRGCVGVAAAGARGGPGLGRLGPARAGPRRAVGRPATRAARDPGRRALAHGRRHRRAPGAAGARARRRQPAAGAGLDGDRGGAGRGRDAPPPRPPPLRRRRDREPPARPRRALRAARPERGADARAARRAADRAQLLRRRHPRGADAGRLGAGLEVGGARGRAPTSRSTATGRGGWRSRPGARPACGPAARTWRRRWPCSAAARPGTRTAAG